MHRRLHAVLSVKRATSLLYDNNYILSHVPSAKVFSIIKEIYSKKDIWSSLFKDNF